MTKIPHLRVVVSVTLFILFGFSMVTAFVLGWSNDEVTKGGIIGTWQNFALLAVGFWLGSSSAGKAKDDAPTPVRVENSAEEPVPVTGGRDA